MNCNMYPPFATPGDPFQYDLRWMVGQIQSLQAFVEQLSKGLDSNSGNIAALNQATKALTDAQHCINDRLNSGDFEDGRFIEWANKNLPAMVNEMVHFVWFGLTDSGRFCAYVPANWKWLTFDTGSDITEPEYGHLIIKYY